MGCVSAHPPVAEGALQQKRGKERGLGYSMQQFLEDYIAPVDCFACSVPTDPWAAKDLAQELHDFHTSRMDVYEKEAIMGRLAPRKPTAPEKAFCMVRLTKVDADIEQNGGAQGAEMARARGSSSFDLKESGRKMPIRLSGAVLVPRSAEWRHPPNAVGEKALQPAPPRHGLPEPMKMIVQVWCHLIAKDVELESGEITRGLIIIPKHLVIKSCGHDSDPMVGSWLPVPDFLECLRLFMNKRIQAAFDESADENLGYVKVESSRRSER